MDTKFSSNFWAHPQVEAAPPEIKLAAAWMRTNDRVTLFGYAAVTPGRFAFETGLPPDTLEKAIGALGEWFARAPGGYFMPGFIGEQIGRGQSLLQNNILKSLVRALVALGNPSVSALVTAVYPEIELALKVIPPAKPLATPPGGGREERRGEEQNREEQRGAEKDRGLGEGGAPLAADPATTPRDPDPELLPPRPPARRETARPPADHPEPLRARMLALNAIFRREPTVAWNPADVAALQSSGLLELHELDFIDQCESVRAFYAAKIPREMETRYRKRTTIRTLLLEWGGELDKAVAWRRQNDDGVTKV